MGSTGKSVNNENVGLPIDWVEYFGVDENGDWGKDVDDDLYRERQRQYAQMLLDAGAFDGDTDDLETAILNINGRSFSFYAHKMTYDWDENLRVLPHTPAVGLARWQNGAWVKGYGSSRQEFDNIYGISSFIDKNPQLQLNTNNTLYRGLRTTENRIQDLYNAMKNKDEISMNGLSSWTSMKKMAEQFTQTTLVGQNNDKLVVFQDETKGRRKAMPYPLSGQAEVLSSGSSRYKIKNIEEKGGIYYVTVTQK